MSNLRFLGEARVLREEFIRLTEWSEEIILCVGHLSESMDEACLVWSSLVQHAAKVRHLLVS